MSTPTVDLATMPLDELRALTIQYENAQNQPPAVDPAPEVTPVAAVPAVDPANPLAGDPTTPPVEDKKRFRRIIDIGDGSGKQEFQGATLDELVENLVKAQENATRKIREQAAQLKAKETPATPAAPAKPLTAEERLAAIEARIAWANTASEFVAAHPDYPNTQKNAVQMERYMAANGIPKTLEGLNQAYTELSESGLLSGTPAPTTTEAVVAPQGIPAAPVAPVSQGTPASSGLTARSGSLTQRAAKVELTEQDLKTMPLDQLRQLTKTALEG